MLILGDHTTIPADDKFISVGILTLKEDVRRLNVILPINVASSEELEFDIKFAEHLLNDEMAFIELMSIMFTLFEGGSIHFISNRDQGYFEAVAESYCKFIQQRYGYNYAVVNELSDIQYLRNGNFTFSLSGLYNFDVDKARYTYLMLNKYPHLVMDERTDSHGNTYKVIREGLLYYRLF